MLYVDGILIISCIDLGIDNVVTHMKEYLEVKDLGRLYHFLDVPLKCNSIKAWLQQRQFTKSIRRRFKTLKCKLVTTSMCVSVIEDLSSESLALKLYKEIIGSFPFLSTSFTTDISITVLILSFHSSNLKKVHIICIQHVLRYLKGTINYGLRTKMKKGNPIAFVESDWGGRPG